nr:ATP-binding protein [uncultured Deefgea sp.]
MTDIFDPYAGNVLVQGLGPILSAEQVISNLACLPIPPKSPKEVPFETRLHELATFRDIFIPRNEHISLQQTVDVMLRQGYRQRNPLLAEAWQKVSGRSEKIVARPFMALLIGHSGTGKTAVAKRIFNLCSHQVIEHENFPHLVGGLRQVVWLSVDAPANGLMSELAANLMLGWDAIMEMHGGPLARRFTETLSRTSRKGPQMFDEWRQVANSHFLGLLHVDEIQNLFKIETLEKRKLKNGTYRPPELRIIDDQTLKMLLSLSNTWGIPLLLSGTPDALLAIQKRVSNLQRVVDSGFHRLEPYKPSPDPEFQMFVQILYRYQYVQQKLELNDELYSTLHRFSAGVPRLLIALWVAVHRIVFEKKRDKLELADFKQAYDRYFKPLHGAIDALHSGDPIMMSRYEDLLPEEDPLEEIWRMSGKSEDQLAKLRKGLGL